MLLIMAFAFTMLSTTAFAASTDTVAVSQYAGIGDFFRSIFKKISETVKSIIDKIVKPAPDPDPEESTTSQVTETKVNENEIVEEIDDSYSGNNVGGDDAYAGLPW